MQHPSWTRLGSRYLPVIAWMGLIFFLSAQPSLPSAPDTLLDFILKKAGHVTVYAVLMILLLRSAESGHGSLTKTRVLACFALAVGYACSDEFHQSLVPGRMPTLTDVILFDTSGVVLGLAWHYRLQLRRH